MSSTNFYQLAPHNRVIVSLVLYLVVSERTRAQLLHKHGPTTNAVMSAASNVSAAADSAENSNVSLTDKFLALQARKTSDTLLSLCLPLYSGNWLQQL